MKTFARLIRRYVQAAVGVVLLLLFSSIQLFCIGIIGEYVGRNFEQSKNRPIYIAKEVIGEEKA